MDTGIKLVLILAVSGGCCFNLRFLLALHRELQLAKRAPQIGKRKAHTSQIKLQPIEPQQEKPCATLCSLESR